MSSLRIIGFYHKASSTKKKTQKLYFHGTAVIYEAGTKVMEWEILLQFVIGQFSTDLRVLKHPYITQTTISAPVAPISRSTVTYISICQG